MCIGLASSASRYIRIPIAAAAPSPTADASCLVEPDTHVARGEHARACSSADPCRSTIKPRSSRSTEPFDEPGVRVEPDEDERPGGVQLLGLPGLAVLRATTAPELAAAVVLRPELDDLAVAGAPPSSGVIIDLVLEQLVARSAGRRARTIVTWSTNCVRNSPSSRPLLPPPSTTSSLGALVERPVAGRAEVDAGADQVVLAGRAGPPVRRAGRDERGARVVVVAGRGLDVDLLAVAR